MRKLRIAAPLGFQTASKEDISAFIRAGLQTHKDLGFDCADFSTPLLDLAGTGWKAQAEQALADSRILSTIYFDRSAANSLYKDSHNLINLPPPQNISTDYPPAAQVPQRG